MTSAFSGSVVVIVQHGCLVFEPSSVHDVDTRDRVRKMVNAICSAHETLLGSRDERASERESECKTEIGNYQSVTLWEAYL